MTELERTERVDYIPAKWCSAAENPDHKFLNLKWTYQDEDIEFVKDVIEELNKELTGSDKFFAIRRTRIDVIEQIDD